VEKNINNLEELLLEAFYNKDYNKGSLIIKMGYRHHNHYINAKTVNAILDKDIEYLKSVGRNYHSHDSFALFIAKCCGDEEVISLLISLGAGI